MYIEFESQCPLEPKYQEPPTSLSNWMGSLLHLKSFQNTTLSSISLPGSHDCLSYDLSLSLSFTAADSYEEVIKVISDFNVLPKEIKELIRLNGQSQKLDIVQQMNNGIRFLDFRIMFESKVIDGSKSTPDWYGIHSLLTNQPAIEYLKDIRDWLDKHSNEIVVIWFSREGSTSQTGENAYPKVPIDEKHKFWSRILEIFQGLMLDTSISDFWSTNIHDLIERNHRLVAFVSDYEEFTNSSSFAYDGKMIENTYHGSVYQERIRLEQQREYLFQTHKENDRSKQAFDLLGMNTASTDWQFISALKERFLPIDPFDSCFKKVNIPGNKICPTSLFDIAQLQNYYNQIIFSEAVEQIKLDVTKVYFPNAFYLDGYDVNGTLRVGSMTLEGRRKKDMDTSHLYSRFAVADAIILYNVASSCKNSTQEDHDACLKTFSTVFKRMEKNSFQYWNDPAFGRRDDWPSEYSYAIG